MVEMFYTIVKAAPLPLIITVIGSSMLRSSVCVDSDATFTIASYAQSNQVNRVVVTFLFCRGTILDGNV